MESTKLRVVALIAAATLALSACGGGGGGETSAPEKPTGGEATTEAGGGEAPARGEALDLGIVQEPASWDPAQAHVGHRLQPFQVPYDTLILREPDGTLVPMLATDWNYTDEARLVFEMNLRDDVTFSDGSPFNAAAVVANIEHFKEDNGPQAGMAKFIDSAEATGDYAVKLTLSQPDPALEYYLSQALGLMGCPEHLGTDEMDRLPIGTGAYTMVAEESVVGSQYVFVAREDYWNPELQKWNNITLKLLPDVTSRINALITNEVDATLLDGTTYEQAEGSGMTGLIWTVDWQGLLLFDRDGALNPALEDVRVRQAINYAFDREGLLQQVTGGHGEVTSQVFGPASSAYMEELDTRYTYDPDKARELLAEAGYADGFDLELPLLTPGGETIMAFVEQQLTDIGIRVTLTQVPGADYQGELGKGNFAAAWFSLFQGPTWVAYQQLLSDTTLFNPFKSSAQEIVAAASVLQLGDDVVPAQAINAYVTENAWFAPWYRPAQLYYYNADVVSVVPQTQMAVPAIYNYSPAG